MLKIFRNINEKTTTALVEDAKFDAVNHILKCYKNALHNSVTDVYLSYVNEDDIPFSECANMNSVYRGVVKCDTRDIYSDEVGESEAVKKAMTNHNKAFNKALLRWQIKMLKFVKDVNPSTFYKAIEKLD